MDLIKEFIKKEKYLCNLSSEPNCWQRIEHARAELGRTDAESIFQLGCEHGAKLVLADLEKFYNDPTKVLEELNRSIRARLESTDV